MDAGLPLLSLLVWLPIAAGVAVVFMGDGRRSMVNAVSVTVTGSCVAISGVAVAVFDGSLSEPQLVERTVWIAPLGAEYYLGVDGISLPLIALTAFIGLLAILGSWSLTVRAPAQYFAAFLVLQGLMTGVFTALDALLFYVFWEAMLIPMFLIIGIWGGSRRIYATIKFFLYTFLGSVFMLIVFIYLYLQTGSFAVLDLHDVTLTHWEQILIFLGFFAAFAIKVPMWPVHTWLPDAHVEAPTAGSMVLAAIMLKMGAYGLLRYAMPIAPDASATLSGFVIVLSLIAIVYIAFVALVQEDLKKLIAYSSIAHMGFVTLGLFVTFLVLADGNQIGSGMAVQGALVQMISHGLISAALFFCVGVLYHRTGSREIAAYSGVVDLMPRFGIFLIVFALANAGLPGTSAFVGEFMVIAATFTANVWYALIAATTVVLGAAYTLWMVKRVAFGSPRVRGNASMPDVCGMETVVLIALAAPILIIGVWPDPLVSVTSGTVEALIAHLAAGKL